METHSENTNFIFWQRWLFYTSLIFALSGIIFAFYQNNILFKSYDKLITQTFWHSAQFPQEAEPFRAFIYGPLGATIACCYILLAFIAWYPFREKQRWARNAIMTAFGVWAIIDSIVCIYFGVYPQVYIINALSITVKALPILFTWNDFRDPLPTPTKNSFK